MHALDWTETPDAGDPQQFTWWTKDVSRFPNPATVGTLVLRFEHKQTVYRPVLLSDVRKLQAYAEGDAHEQFNAALAALSDSATSVRTVTTDETTSKG